ncbi:MAG: LytR family transcriptional regulator [Chloroflexi bacterium]|nr:MAG: LytR family transcriptional regulator [Chloroflexota bacterium]
MRIPGWLLAIGVVVFLFATAICSIITFSFTRQAVIDLQAGSGVVAESPFEAIQVALGFTDPLAISTPAVNITIPTLTPTIPPTATPRPTNTPQASGVIATLPPLATATPVPTATEATVLSEIEPLDPRRFTILVMGIDQRSAVEDRGPFRTDTMMLINVDPIRKSVGVISIPRDLWVTIPGFQPNRINTANQIGEANAYPGLHPGPALAAATVAHNLGIHVDKYVRINFDVFTRVVETIAPDGVEICVTEYIDDPDYPDAGYGYIHVTFQPGCQIMHAEQLLQYARTRATEGGDFDRARRQQQVLDALRRHVLSLGGLTNLIAQIPTLWTELSGSFQTNLTQSEVIRLAQLLTEVRDEDIHMGVINNLYTTLGTTPSGDQILIPKQDAITFLIEQTFFPHLLPDIAELHARAQRENASIVVFNNTDITGLASQTAEWLTGQGVLVTDVGNVPNAPNQPTYIQVYTGKYWTARWLAAILGLPPERIQPGADGLTTRDVMLVVGPDIYDYTGLTP